MTGHIPAQWYESAVQSIAKKDAEIEQLRAADKSRVAAHEAEIRRLGIAMGAQADEIARLTAEVATCRELRKYDSSEKERLQALVAKLRTRVELADK